MQAVLQQNLWLQIHFSCQINTLHWSLSQQLHWWNFTGHGTLFMEKCAIIGDDLQDYLWWFLFCCKNWWMNLFITTIASVQILRCTKLWPSPKVEWAANQMDVWRSASYGLKPQSIVLATIKIWGSITSRHTYTSNILPLRIGESWSLPTMSTNTHPPMAQHDCLALKNKLSSRLRWSLIPFPSWVNGITLHPGKPWHWMKLTLPKTSIAPENGNPQEETSSFNHGFSGANCYTPGN